MSKYNKGQKVRFTPDNPDYLGYNNIYEVEFVENDCVYLIDKDGSSFTAIFSEIELL